MASRNNIKVVCRFRPLNKIELRKKSRFCAVIDDNRKQAVSMRADGQSFDFAFDRVFGTKSSQEEVYKYSADAILDEVLKGYNGCLLAYGQTGAGKTHTMTGPDMDDDRMKGIIPRVVDRIFEHATCAEETVEFSVKCSYLEIYLERIRDLLDPTKNNLQVHEHPNGSGVYVKGATEVYVTSETEMLEVMREGNENRQVAATGMNEGSSRSHAIFCVVVEQNNAAEGEVKIGRLYLVDLAGSEMISKTGVTGQQLEEAKKINKSLSALGNVIKALTEKSSMHVPYRDSKLTRMLQESLGGNSKTALIINCSPSSYNFTETVSTLRFGQRAKAITNKAEVNKMRTPEQMERYIAKLEAALKKLSRGSVESALSSDIPDSPPASPAIAPSPSPSPPPELPPEGESKEPTGQPASTTDATVAALTGKLTKMSSKLAKTKVKKQQLEERVATLMGLLQESSDEIARLQNKVDRYAAEESAAKEGVPEPGSPSRRVVNKKRKGKRRLSVAQTIAKFEKPKEVPAVVAGEEEEETKEPAAAADAAQESTPAPEPASVSETINESEPAAPPMPPSEEAGDDGAPPPAGDDDIAPPPVDSADAGDDVPPPPVPDTLDAAAAAAGVDLQARLDDASVELEKKTARIHQLEMEIANLKQQHTGTPSTSDMMRTPVRGKGGPVGSPATPLSAAATPASVASVASASPSGAQLAVVVPCQPRLSAGGGIDETVEVFQNEQKKMFGGWTDKTSRGAWSDRTGKFAVTREEVLLPSPEWCWLTSWTLVINADTDAEGWSYGLTFADLETPRAGGRSAKAWTDTVRRRRWVRTRVRIAIEGASATTNKMLQMSHQISAALEAKKTLAAQVHKDRELIDVYEARINELMQRLADQEMQQPVHHGGTAFKRTIRGRGRSGSTATGAGHGVGAGSGGSPLPRPVDKKAEKMAAKKAKSLSTLDRDQTKFLTAAEYGRLPELQALAKKVDPPQVVDKEGRNAAHYAARGESVEVLEYLAGLKVDVLAIDSNGRTPLHYAARYGRVEVGAWLVDKGASPQEIDQHAITPLHQAALGNQKRMCHWLLEHGADINAVDSAGLTAERLANSMKRQHVVDFLGMWQKELERKAMMQKERATLLQAAGVQHH